MEKFIKFEDTIKVLKIMEDEYINIGDDIKGLIADYCYQETKYHPKYHSSILLPIYYIHETKEKVEDNCNGFPIYGAYLNIFYRKNNKIMVKIYHRDNWDSDNQRYNLFYTKDYTQNIWHEFHLR